MQMSVLSFNTLGVMRLKDHLPDSEENCRQFERD